MAGKLIKQANKLGIVADWLLAAVQLGQPGSHSSCDVTLSTIQRWPTIFHRTGTCVTPLIHNVTPCHDTEARLFGPTTKSRCLGHRVPQYIN